MTARIRLLTIDEFAPFLGRLTGKKFDTTAGAVNLADMCSGSELFGIERGGELVGAYALRVDGKTCWLMAAVMMMPSVDFETEILPVIERQAQQVGQVAVTTKRRGGVKKLLRQGYEITGVTLRKNLKC